MIDSPKRMNIEEDHFHYSKPQNVTNLQNQKRTLRKSLSQAEIVSAVKQQHEVSIRDNPFQNLNAAVNELNDYSIKRQKMLPKDDLYDSEATTLDRRQYEGKRNYRRHSGSLSKKELAEDVVEIHEEDSHRQTAHFKPLPEYNSSDTIETVNKNSNDMFKETMLSVNEELVFYPKASESQTSRRHDSVGGVPRYDQDLKSKPMSSRKPHIPKDPRDHRFHGHSKQIKKSQVQKNKKAHQLSINIRKASPIKAEVDLYTTHSRISEQSESIPNIKSLDIRDDFVPGELEIENIKPEYTSRKPKEEDEVRGIKLYNEPPVRASNRLSFSSSHDSEFKEPLSENIQNRQSQRKQVPSTRYDQAVSDYTESCRDPNSIPTSVEKTSRKASEINFVTSEQILDESKHGRHFKVDNDLIPSHQIETLNLLSKANSTKAIRSNSTRAQPGSRVPSTTHNRNKKSSTLSFSGQETECKIDEDVIEKYCNILSQKTFTSKPSSRTQKDNLGAFSSSLCTQTLGAP